jgi:glycosyltransferase involved in cell wall biosynthesis
MLAIVIPYYKLTFFEETMQSLANQTDKRFKVYIGDDASTENPADLLQKFKGKFDFDYHRFESNLGGSALTKQWERCISLSGNEEWIMILGDDDYLDDSFVASWYKNYNTFNTKSNVIRFASQLVYEELKCVSKVFNHPVWETATESYYRKFKKTSRSSLSEYVFTRSAYDKYGYCQYPLAWNSDDRSWLDFSDNKPLFTINESIVYVRMSGLNISGRQDNLEMKYLSEIEFYKFIFSNKFIFYNNEQRLRLLQNYQSILKKTNKLSLYERVLILFFYLKYFNIDWCIKGYKRVLKNFKKG